MNICFEAIQNSCQSNRLLQACTETFNQILLATENCKSYTEECVVNTEKHDLLKK